MVKYTIPASIECSECSLNFRKITPSLPKLNSILNKILYPHKCDRGCKAYITKELKPKKFIIDKNSMLNKNDGIRGKTISVQTDNIIKSGSIGTGSAKHKSQSCLVKGYIYARLQIQYSTVPQNN